MPLPNPAIAPRPSGDSAETSGLAEDGSRFRVRNEFWRADRTLAARVTRTGGWLDPAARKLVAPSPAMLAVMHTVELTDDFETLLSSIR